MKSAARYPARSRRYPRSIPLGLVAGALLAACAGDPDPGPLPAAEQSLEAREPAAASAAAATAAAARTSQVTLITGDRVTFTQGGDREPVFTVERGPGRNHVEFVARVTRERGVESLVVVPTDAVPLVAAGQLDEVLFNVSELVREGYDDSSVETLPLIVTYGGAPPRSLAVRGAQSTRWLASVNGEAIRADKRDAGALWSSITGGASGSAGAPRALTAGVAKVWLDRRATLLLDQSVPQIGAPKVWAAGFTGKGVTVAILDTGVRANHPDLAGKIVDAVDFTGTLPSADDDVGHGTHVAGIIAGSGAASGGRYRGVAPDASLLIGKVCVRSGCSASAIIAGMEWAAAKARIVNMSLGTNYASDGTDVLSLAVNQLTAQYGTLFVAAAGNAGADESVGAPAAADAALAVGSVSKQDAQSSFSSRGPRIGDYAVKPEITAPGGDIIAARAKGTPVGDTAPIDDNYTRLSGTSMATPHVAGGAALLAQQHLEWTAAELKAALMGAAKPLTGIPVIGEGAGRLDLVRATTQVVRATVGSLSFGVAPFPHEGALTKTVTYRNDGDVSITLDLTLDVVSADGRPAPAGLFTTSAKVVVPAHGTADTTVTVTGRRDVSGFFSGDLIAGDGVNAVVTALAVLEEPQRFNLTINNLNRSGDVASWVNNLVYDVDAGIGYGGVARGPMTLRLPPGEYDINEIVSDPSGLFFAAQPSVILDRDTTVTIDGRTAKPVTVVLDRPTARLQSNSITLNSRSRDGRTGSSLLTLSYSQLYVTPTAPVTGHRFNCVYRAWFVPPAPPPGGAVQENYLYNLAFLQEGGIPNGLTYRVPDRDLGIVYARYHAAGDTLGYRSNLGTTPENASSYVDLWAQPVPGTRLEYYTATISWTETLQLYGLTGNSREYMVSHPQIYEPGRFYVRGWNRAPFGPSFGPREPYWGAYRIKDRISVYLTPFNPSEDEHVLWNWRGTTTLSRDGQVVGTAERAAYAAFDVSGDAGTYTLDVKATRTVAWSALGTSLDASWTFRSAPAGDTALHNLPLLIVHAAGVVDDHDNAPAGLPYLLALDVQRQPNAPVAATTKLTLEVSYDDGATWTRALVGRSGDRGVALLFHPRTPGFVSLRAHAEDAAGNAVTQTVGRAYRTTALP